MWNCGRSETFDAIILQQKRRKVKDNHARKGGELDVTTTLVIVAVMFAAVNIMKIIEALDAPEKDRRQRA